MEIVVGIAVGVLVVVIIFSTIGIVVAVKTRCCRKPKEDSDQPQNRLVCNTLIFYHYEMTTFKWCYK